MPDQPITSFRQNDGNTIDVYLVRLPSGAIVARTRDELERAPAPPSPNTIRDPRR